MNHVARFFAALVDFVTLRGTPRNPWRVGDEILYRRYEGVIVSLDTDEWGRDCAIMKTSTGMTLVVLLHTPPAWRRPGDAEFFEEPRVSVNASILGMVCAEVLLVWIVVRWTVAGP